VRSTTTTQRRERSHDRHGHGQDRKRLQRRPSLEEPSFTYLEDWWQDVVFEYTGDGHGNGDNGKLGSCYTATIIRCDNPVFLDESFEWID
jgi:hypothetical protein